MASFWDRVAAGGRQPQQQTAPPPPVQHPQTVPNGPWWRPDVPTVQPQAAPQQPQQVPIYNAQGQIVGFTLVDAPQQVPMPQPGQQYVTPEEQAHIDAAMKLAKSAKSTDRCPECDSGNYIKVKAHGTVAERCYDCGHNPMFDQQAAGMPTDPGTPTQASRQAGTDQNNFNPKTFDPARGGAGVVRL